jgi:hypothetical protein
LSGCEFPTGVTLRKGVARVRVSCRTPLGCVGTLRPAVGLTGTAERSFCLYRPPVEKRHK